jgi:hypothetical protein
MNVSTMLWEAAGIFILIQTALGWVGWAFGKSKGRAVAGFVLGFLLGPIGLILTIALPRQPGCLPVKLPPICPTCFEALTPGATRCSRCDGGQAAEASGIGRA